MKAGASACLVAMAVAAAVVGSSLLGRLGRERSAPAGHAANPELLDPRELASAGRASASGSAGPARSDPLRSASDLRPGWDRYRILLKTNPFASRLPAERSPAPTRTPALPAPQAVRTAPPAPPNPAPAQPAPTEPPDPLKDWIYSGTVVIGPDVYAVVEHRVTKRGHYLKPGDPFEGGVVEVVGDRELLLAFGGGYRTLPKSTAFQATPFSAPAAASPREGTPGARGSQPGVPGRPGAAPGAPPAPGAPAGVPAPVQRPAPVPAPAPAPN